VQTAWGFNGIIDAVGLWGKVLTDAEIENLYYSTRGQEHGFGTAPGEGAKQATASLTVSPGDLADNNPVAALPQATYYESNAFARAIMATNATLLTVEVYTALSNAAGNKINIKVDGADFAILSPVGIGAQSLPIALPAGDKIVEIVSSFQESGIIGSFIKGYSVNTTAVPIRPVPSRRLLVYGDSIAVGAGATTPIREAWTILLRAVHPSVTVEAWAGRGLTHDGGSAIQRNLFAQKLSYCKPTEIWLAIGTNDYIAPSMTASAFETAYGNLLDAIHSWMPGAVVYAQSPTVRTVETANGFGDTLPQYRTAIANAVSTRTAYTTLVNGTAIFLLSDLADTVHPNAGGNLKYFNYVKGVLAL
jgi:lysophospholipase L1-like esterase